MLAFGHTAGLPPDTDTAWGAQATITPHGTLNVPADRTDLVGPRAAQLRAHLDNHVRAAWRDRAIELHRAGLLRPGHDGKSCSTATPPSSSKPPPGPPTRPCTSAPT